MNPHGRQSIRYKDYDYSQQGMYYITLCINQRDTTFGNIHNRSLVLNQYGTIAERYLLALQDKFINISIDEYIIMPDHIHAIIQITEAYEAMERTNRRNMLLPKVIGFYKMNVAKQINLMKKSQGLAFWQRNY